MNRLSSESRGTVISSAFLLDERGRTGNTGSNRGVYSWKSVHQSLMEYHHDEKCHEIFFNAFIKFRLIIPVSLARTRLAHDRADTCVHTRKRLDRQLSGTSCSRSQANIQL